MSDWQETLSCIDKTDLSVATKEGLKELANYIEKLEAENAKLRQIISTQGNAPHHYLAELESQHDKYREALEAVKLLVDAQAEDEGLWGIPLDGLQQISEAYLQQELRRLHECIEHYTKEALRT